MLQAIRSAFGDDGLERLTEGRTRQQAQNYRARLPGQDAPLEERVATLTGIRDAVERSCAGTGGARFWRSGRAAGIRRRC